MHATCFAWKTSRSFAAPAVRPATAGMLAVALVLQLGCATRKPQGVTRLGSKLSDPIFLEPGVIVVASPRAAADFSFDKAEGRTDYAGEGAGNFARDMLFTPPRGDPRFEAAEGVISFALAPLAAMVGAVSASHARLGPAQLAQAETNLTVAMALMAEQQRLRDCVAKAAGEKTRRRIVTIDSANEAGFPEGPVCAVIETRIENLRLVRTGASDTSFALEIKARTRLVRARDGAVVYDEPFEYRSGTALFHDWTLDQSVRNVADTGYRKLADQMTGQLFLATRDDPVLVGAGFKNSIKPAGNSRFSFAATPVQPPGRPLAQFASYPVSRAGAIGVFSTASVARVTIQQPVTKDEANEEAMKEVNDTLGDLAKFPNIVVQLGTFAAAIPISMWKQGVAAVRGISERNYQAADEQLSAAVRQTQPHEELAAYVAAELGPRTAQQVVLVKKSLPADADREFATMQCVARGTLAWLPPGQSAENYLVSHGGETALEIHVISASLKGGESINPPLRLEVEAQATLLRSRDGQKIYSCPVRYRGRERSFTEWAAHDARLFREETQRCYSELSRAIADQLVSRRVIAPLRGSNPILAVTK